jgi:hypothetical protein
MGIRAILRKLINPGAVSQPPPSKTPESPVVVPNQGVQEATGVSSEPTETPVAEASAIPAPENIEVSPPPAEQEIPVAKAPETEMPSTTSVEPEAPMNPTPGAPATTTEPDIKG